MWALLLSLQFRAMTAPIELPQLPDGVADDLSDDDVSWVADILSGDSMMEVSRRRCCHWVTAYKIQSGARRPQVLAAVQAIRRQHADAFRLPLLEAVHESIKVLRRHVKRLLDSDQVDDHATALQYIDRIRAFTPMLAVDKPQQVEVTHSGTVRTVHDIGEVVRQQVGNWRTRIGEAVN